MNIGKNWKAEMTMLPGMAIGALLGAAILASGNAAFACSVPNLLTNGQTADATQVMADFNALAACADAVAPGGAANSVQYRSGTGNFAGVAPLTNGQVIIGKAADAPQPQTLLAGPGIAILNGTGNITIAATGGTGGAGVNWLNAAALVPPTASAFTLRTSTTPSAGSALAATARGMMLSTSAIVNGAAIMAETAVPAGHWQATMLAVYTGSLSDFNLPAIAVRDSVNNRAVEFGIGGTGTTRYRFDYFSTSGGIGLDNRIDDIQLQDTGLPPPSEPVWSRLAYDGTNFVWSFSRDGENFITAFTISATDKITNLNTIGPAVVFAQTTRNAWAAGFHILSWDVATL